MFTNGYGNNSALFGKVRVSAIDGAWVMLPCRSIARTVRGGFASVQ